MADTALQVVVSPFLGVLFDNLSKLIKSKIALVWGVQNEMKKLSRTLSIIKDVLNDAEEKQLADKAVRSWLIELKDAAYDADDVLDECAFEGLQLGSEIRNNSYIKQVTDLLKLIKFRHRLGRKIKELRERFHDIAEERSKFHFREGIAERRFELCQETSSLLNEPEVYGRDADKENLLSILLNNVNSQEDISICAILGIGGLGKTTLAQLVYNNESLVAGHFEVKAWVCVTNDFDLKCLIKAIIVSLSGNPCHLEGLDPLERRLQEELRGKRFLLVLDDVWNENQDDWSKLKCSLRCGAKGSSIILTTRLGTVASITGTVPAYHLEGLSEDDCWSLFKKRAFGQGNEEREDLVKIGKAIVKKCGGVPLAAKALGGLMRFKSEKNEWLFVRDSELWDLPESSENNIFPALRLSYNHLPSDWRQCFAYCSVFPKDYEIKKEELIRLWMANGLVQPKGKMELEDVGNEIFYALLWRSFFQDIKKNEDGSINTCKMHDLMHDLACHIAADECSVIDTGKAKKFTARVRHLSLVVNTRPSPSMLKSISNLSCLRSLISVYDRPSMNRLHIKNPELIFSSLIRLRALDLSQSAVTELPHSIGKMKHLRYLNLSETIIASLPESICGLRNLQTLKLMWCDLLQTLPKDMRKMRSLRHLDIQGCDGLINMPIGIGKLTSLQTLSFFIVGLENGRGIKELQGLDLGGELQLKGLEHVKNSMDAKDANLMRKKQLGSLQLPWSHSHIQENATEVIEGLQPHSNVKQLLIQGYKGVTFPSWLTVSSLPNLVRIFLSRCSRCEHLPSLRELPLLKVLKISSMDSVRFIVGDTYGGNVVDGFQSLERLKLSLMPNLEGWSSSQGGERVSLPCLKSLTLLACPKLTGVPFSSSLQRLKVRKCNEMVLGSLQSLPCLHELEIYEFDELLYFPEGMLRNVPALQILEIGWCNNLKTLPAELESLTTLTRLSISECRELVSVPEGLRNLRSLKSLVIGNCHGLKTLSNELQHLKALENLCIYECPELEFSAEAFHHLVNLRDLSLSGLPKLTCFPEGIKQATMLQDLSIQRCCSDLMELPDWIGTLTSLQALEIHGCKNQKILPEGMQHLTVLQVLQIRGCDPDIERRCKKDKGEDWYKIAHVSRVLVETEDSFRQRTVL